MRVTGASDDNIAARKAAGKQTAHGRIRSPSRPLVHERLPQPLPIAGRSTGSGHPTVLVTTGGPILHGGPALGPLDRAADELADLPHAQRETLEGPDHVVDPQTVGPLLLRFFSSEH